MSISPRRGMLLVDQNSCDGETCCNTPNIVSHGDISKDISDRLDAGFAKWHAIFHATLREELARFHDSETKSSLPVSTHFGSENAIHSTSNSEKSPEIMSHEIGTASVAMLPNSNGFIKSPKSLSAVYADRKRDMPKLERCVYGNKFNTLISVLIILNTFAIGMNSHYAVLAAFDKAIPPEWLPYADMMFVGIFTAELLLRLVGQGWHFIKGRDKVWNFFDTFLVFSAIATVFDYLANLSFLRIIRALRLLRTIRVLKTLRVLQDLRLMMVSIMASFVSLFWACLMIVLLIYMFSVIFMLAGADYVIENGLDDQTAQDVFQYFGGLGTSVLTLTFCFTSGMNWSEPFFCLYNVAPVYGILFLFYILFMGLGVLNVLTGIFVDNASNVARIDRDLVVDLEMQEKMDVARDLERLFNDMSGCCDKPAITLDEFSQIVECEEMQANLKILGVESRQALDFFKLLDTSNDGALTMDEFVSGCLRLRGSAKEVDLATLLRELKRMSGSHQKFLRALDASYKVSQAKNPPHPRLASMRTQENVGGESLQNGTMRAQASRYSNPRLAAMRTQENIGGESLQNGTVRTQAKNSAGQDHGDNPNQGTVRTQAKSSAGQDDGDNPNQGTVRTQGASELEVKAPKTEKVESL